MNVLVAVDPGKEHAGVAVFVDDLLWAATVVRHERAPDVATGTLRQGKHKVNECAAPNAVARLVQRFVSSVALGADGHLVVDDFVCEFMKVYLRKGKADPEDLLWVGSTMGAVAARLNAKRERFVEPAEWKGQVPDTICWNRIRGRVKTNEVEMLIVQCLEREFGAQAHHGLEAIGIGLWALRRF